MSQAEINQQFFNMVNLIRHEFDERAIITDELLNDDLFTELVWADMHTADLHLSPEYNLGIRALATLYEMRFDEVERHLHDSRNDLYELHQALVDILESGDEV